MGTAFDAGNEMAEAALVATSLAACVIPAAWACAGEMYKMQSDPGAMFAAGQTWLEVAGKIGDAVTANEGVTNSIGGTGWRGSDFEAFTDKAAHLSQELMVSQVFAFTVGIAMIAMSVALFTSILVMDAIAVVLAANAAIILAAVASIIGDFGPAEALEAEANVIAGEFAVTLTEMAGMLSSLSHVLAGGITALLAGDVAIQSALGNGQALNDLAQASVDGIGTITTGLVAAVYKEAIGGLTKVSPIAGAIGVTDTVTGDTIVGRISKPYDPTRN